MRHDSAFSLIVEFLREGSIGSPSRSAYSLPTGATKSIHQTTAASA